MIILVNNKKITVTFEGLEIEPLGSVRLTEEQWAELYKRREIRQSVAIGYMTASNEKITPEPAKEEIPATQAKSKKGK